MQDSGVVEAPAVTQAETGEATVADLAPVEGPGGVDANPGVAAEYLDPEAFGNHLVKVKVDGEEIDVPFSELRNGHMRHADYTRKTQELAKRQETLSQAEALAVALDTNPIGVIQTLAETYGWQPNGGQADEGPSWDEMTLEQRELAELKAWKAEQSQRQLQSQIEEEFTALESKYGEIDRHALIAEAMRTGLTVTQAYQVSHYATLEQQLAAKQADEAATAAKRAAAVVGGGGGSAPAGALTPAASGKPMSVRESWRAALKAHGVS